MFSDHLARLRRMALFRKGEDRDSEPTWVNIKEWGPQHSP